MSTRAETVEFLTDQLSALPTIRSRKMFGEYCCTAMTSPSPSCATTSCS